MSLLLSLDPKIPWLPLVGRVRMHFSGMPKTVFNSIRRAVGQREAEGVKRLCSDKIFKPTHQLALSKQTWSDITKAWLYLKHNNNVYLTVWRSTPSITNTSHK